MLDDARKSFPSIIAQNAHTHTHFFLVYEKIGKKNLFITNECSYRFTYLYAYWGHKVKKVDALRLNDVRLQLLPIFYTKKNSIQNVLSWTFRIQNSPFFTDSHSLVRFSFFFFFSASLTLSHFYCLSFSNGCVSFLFSNPYFQHEWARCVNVPCCFSHNFSLLLYVCAYLYLHGFSFTSSSL